MSAKALAQVLVRLWGLVLIIDVTASIGIVAMLFSGPNEFRPPFVPTAIAVTLRAIFGIMLIRNGDRVGAWMTGDIDESGPPADATQIQTVAFGILGAYFLLLGLAELSGLAYTFLTKAKWDETGTLAYIWERQKETFAPSIVHTVGGAILLFRRVSFGKTISRSWSAIRGREETNGEA